MDLSKLVAGNEKFLSLLLGAIIVYVQATQYIPDVDLKNLVSAVLVACQGWLATNTPVDDLHSTEIPTVPTSE